MPSTEERVSRKLRPEFMAKVVAALKAEAESWVYHSDTLFTEGVGQEVLRTIECAESDGATDFEIIECVEGVLDSMQDDLPGILATFRDVIKTGKR